MGVPDGTIYCWIKAFKEGRLSANEAVHTPKTVLSLNDELIELRKRVKELDKENHRLREENEFLEEDRFLANQASQPIILSVPKSISGFRSPRQIFYLII